MASLVIRDLDDTVKERLRVQAAEHGRSVEAEARDILATAVGTLRPRTKLGSHIRDRAADLGGIELDVTARSQPAGNLDLDLDER